jgi:hypothetical protein
MALPKREERGVRRRRGASQRWMERRDEGSSHSPKVDNRGCWREQLMEREPERRLAGEGLAGKRKKREWTGGGCSYPKRGLALRPQKREKIRVFYLFFYSPTFFGLLLQSNSVLFLEFKFTHSFHFSSWF